jgi:ATP-binding cassette, subfamily B, bacterial
MALPHGDWRRSRARDRAAPTWGERARALRHLSPFLKMVWATHRGYTAAIVALRLVRAWIPLATLWVGKLIVDTIVLAVQTGDPDWSRLLTLVLIEFGVVAAGEVAARTGSLLESLLGDLFSNGMSVRLMEHAATLDIQHFEDPVFYDRLERARRHTVGRIALLSQILGMAQDALTLLTLAGTLLAFSPLLFLLLIVAVLPAFLGETHFAALGYSLLYRWTPERRKLDYYRWVGASDRTAKEVKLFGLSNKLIREYAVLADRFYRENRSLAIRRNLVGTALALVSTAGYYAAYGTIIYRTAIGVLTLGDLTLLAGSFSRSRDLIQRMLLATSDLYEQALYLDDLFIFFSMKPSVPVPENPRPIPRPIREGFEFRDVWFRYPGSEADLEAPLNGDSADSVRDPRQDQADGGWVLRGVSFRIKPGERWALVGENGAGKTTLIKLLLRLYEPTRGEILLDGVRLSEYDPAEYHATVSVTFQDFVRYDMVAEENIAMDQPVSESGQPAPAIVEAAERSLAAGVIDALPQRYGTMLGRRFEGGVDLSGGQWQKVALARAYLRDAQVLILDEPTAALDARAEFEVFQRFADLTRGKIAILISHRFSTVRMADRILVMEDGRVLEEGGHEDLIASGGRYAELFGLQAAGYR